jgi:hypothetical protein
MQSVCAARAEIELRHGVAELAVCFGCKSTSNVGSDAISMKSCHAVTINPACRWSGFREHTYGA